jgi:magnesium transporter
LERHRKEIEKKLNREGREKAGVSMARRIRKGKHRREFSRRTMPGAPPGSIVVDPQAPKPVITVIAYGAEKIREEKPEDPGMITPLLGQYPVLWINVAGLGDASVIDRMGVTFQLHRLALEDVVNTHQRAKVEHYPNSIFVVGRMVESAERIETDQLSLFLGKDFVLTFQETPGDCFDPVRERIRKGGGTLRLSGPDYLAYALIDAFVDNYFPILETYGEKLESMEELVVSHPDPGLISQIHEVKRDLLTLRRAIWPLREAINSLVREPVPLIAAETRIYLRDCYDHTIQIIDLLENYRDVASGLMEVYLSSMSNRLNEVMKILTMFTALFIPMSLIAGIYGMNFNTQASRLNMPELNWYFGYPFALGLMVVIALVLLLFFRRKGWLGNSQSNRNKRKTA